MATITDDQSSDFSQRYFSQCDAGSWAGTLHGHFYWQSGSYWRILNDSDYDKLRSYTSINLVFIFTNQDGWQVMVQVKNLVDTTAITGVFLISDDTGLTTNVFTIDPRLFGIRITKCWQANPNGLPAGGGGDSAAFLPEKMGGPHLARMALSWNQPFQTTLKFGYQKLD